MARARKSSGRRRRRHVHWVCPSYGAEYDLESGGAQDAFVLAHARNQMGVNLASTATPLSLAGAGVPSMQRVRAIRGWISIIPGANWIANTVVDLALRVIEAPQDLATAAAIVDTNYSLDDYTFADEPFLWEWKEHAFFTASTPTPERAMPIDIRVGRRLDDNNGLFLVLENLGNVRIQGDIWLRTLMSM